MSDKLNDRVNGVTCATRMMIRLSPEAGHKLKTELVFGALTSGVVAANVMGLAYHLAPATPLIVLAGLSGGFAINHAKKIINIANNAERIQVTETTEPDRTAPKSPAPRRPASSMG